MKTKLNLDSLKNVFIVAELSANHNGSLDVAIETVRAAKRAGANAIKLQTYTPDTITLDCNKDDFIIKSNSIWDGQKYYELYKKAFTPWEWHKRLFEEAYKLNLICFSSPFDKTAVDFLEGLGNPIYKVASFEITDIPLIEYIATKGKPIILSTGIARLDDIELAINTCKKAGNYQIILLKCVSSYPSPIDEANLVMISDLAERFKLKTGLSDHTLGIIAPIVAVTQGAKIIEKHFILDKSIGGPDASFSLDENEFKEMVEAIRDAEISIGKVDYNLNTKQNQARNFSRSLYVVKSSKKGEFLTNKNIKSIRPGYGLHPKYLKKVLGKKFKRDVEAGERLTHELIL